MNEDFKKAVAEVEEKLGTLEGFIVMAIDDKRQFNTLHGKCAKMLTQIAGDSDEIMKLLEESIRAAKLSAKMKALIEEAKAQGLIPDEEKEEAETQTISE